MSANFFEWIRDGVRQSVLLGVSDAIEELGTPAQGEETHPESPPSWLRIKEIAKGLPVLRLPRREDASVWVKA
jgi:hypothetical protein